MICVISVSRFILSFRFGRCRSPMVTCNLPKAIYSIPRQQLLLHMKSCIWIPVIILMSSYPMSGNSAAMSAIRMNGIIISFLAKKNDMLNPKVDISVACDNRIWLSTTIASFISIDVSYQCCHVTYCYRSSRNWLPHPRTAYKWGHFG